MRGVCAFVAGLTVLVPGLAQPCGESLYRVGKGVHYRAYSAPIPGTVLLYARTDEERAIAEQLRQAGHQVLVVEDDVDLSLQIRQPDVDVVIAPAGKQAVIESGSAAVDSPAAWVPVYDAGTAETRALRARYGRGVDRDDEVRKYLKVIHYRLRDRDG